MYPIPLKPKWKRNLCPFILAITSALATSGAALAGPHYIVGGEAEGNFPAAGALIYDNEVSCSGTLISPRVVLTAAHCLAEFGSAQGHSFFLGTNANDLQSGTTIEVTQLIPHAQYSGDGDSYDIGVVRLAADAPVAPSMFNTQTMDDTFVGKTPLFVGYGVTSGQGSDAGTKRSVTVPITSFEADGFRYASDATGTCFGDSGGPAFLQVGGNLTVIGVTSWGDENCEEFGVNTRTDLYAEFLQCVVDNGSDCGGRVIDGSGSSTGGTDDNDSGGGQFPDDWCTNGDGICDEPCDTPDTDCGDAQDMGGEPGEEEGYCVADDGYCDDWCNPPDPDCDASSETENSEENSQSGDNQSQNDTEEAAGTESNSDSGSLTQDTLEPSVPSESVDQGGCAQASPNAPIFTLLMGAWVMLRRRRVDAPFRRQCRQ